MAPLTSVQTAVLYINICCFISDFRSVVNFNYVTSPKFVPNRKDFIISALPYHGFEVVKVFEVFNITK